MPSLSFGLNRMHKSRTVVPWPKELKTKQCQTVTIWIPSTQNPDSSEYRTNSRIRHIQYSGDLNTRHILFLNGRKVVGHQMVWFLNAIWIQDTQLFKFQTNDFNFVKTMYLIYNRTFWIQCSKHLVFKWFNIWIFSFQILTVLFWIGYAVRWGYESRPIKNRKHP